MTTTPSDQITSNTSPAELNQRPPKVGLVGCGRWGKNLIRNFNALGSLQMICDQSSEALSKFQQEYPNVETTQEFANMLTNPVVEGIVIATPSWTHYELAKQALEAGKHVYVEKPLAIETDHVNHLLSLAAQKNRHIMVGHLLLYHPTVHRFKQLVRDGELGEIRYVESYRCNYNPFRSDISVLWDLAPHDISMMSDVLDSPPESLVSVQGQRTGHDNRVDMAQMTVRFENGVEGTLYNSWVSPVKQVQLKVYGTECLGIFDDTLPQNKLSLLSRGRELSPAPISESDRSTPEYLLIEPLKLECQQFLTCIKEDTQPKTHGQHAAPIIKVLEDAHKALGV